MVTANHPFAQAAGFESQTSSISVPWNENGMRLASNVSNVERNWRTRLLVLNVRDTFIVETIILGKNVFLMISENSISLSLASDFASLV